MQNPVQSYEKEFRQRTLLNLIEEDPRFNLSKAAKAIGVKPSAVQEWCRSDKAFARELEQLRAEAATQAVDELEDTCHDVAKAGDVQALKFMLQAHKPDRYRPDTKGLTNNGTVINIGSITVVPREAPAELPALDIKPTEV